MKKTLRLLVPLAAASLAMAATPLAAQADSGEHYQATLKSLNGSGGSGSFTMTLKGDQATVEMNWSGLAKTFKDGPFPHVQHIHIGGDHVCPTKSNDKNGDGVISTPEGQPAYGGIGTTLSVKGDTSPKSGTDIKIAPGGSSLDYKRTFTLNAKTRDALKNNTGVVVVHGLDPSTLSKKAQKAKSPLVPSLPLAATAPALCGPVNAMPTGGANTGVGSTDGLENAGLFGLGGLLVAGGLYAGLRRRKVAKVD